MNQIISYLRANQGKLVLHLIETVRSQPEKFPLYSKLEDSALYQRAAFAIDKTLGSIEKGEFDDAKNTIDRIFGARLRTGFEPNELIRAISLITDSIRDVILSVPAELNQHTLYLQRVNAVDQVIKMYIAMLNLSIPKEERNEVDLALLEFAI
jgi:hypothetical protein